MSDGVLVSIVDDDPSVLESLPDLVRTFGFASRAFASAEAFLTSELLEETKCLILDVAMPEMSGPELWRELGLAYRRDRTLSVASKTFISVVRQLSDYLKKPEA